MSGIVIEPPEGGWQGHEVLTAWQVEMQIPVRSGFWLYPVAELMQRNLVSESPKTRDYRNSVGAVR